MKPLKASFPSSFLSLALAAGAFAQETPLVVSASTVNAPQVPRLIRFGGVIDGVQGGSHVIFTLYKDQKGGAPLWQEGQEVTFDDKGAYSIFLGGNHSAGIPADIFTSGEARWLGVQVDGKAEEKRILLVSVPYALKAGDAETIQGKPLSAFVLSGETTGVSDGLHYLDTTAGTSVSSKNVIATALTSTGTLNRVAKFDALGNVLNSSIFDNGKVGIGTTSPQRTLDVGKGGQITFGDTGYSSANSPGLFWYNSNSLYGIYKTAGTWVAPIYQQLAMNWPTGIVIDGGTKYGRSGVVLQPTGGHVGIGITAPTQALDVYGNIQTSQNLMLPATSITGGVIMLGGKVFMHAYADTDAFGSTFLGEDAGNFTMGGAYDEGSRNTGIGYYSLHAVTTGSYNTALGHASLDSDLMGSYNTAIGMYALSQVTNGGHNVALGDFAGQTVTTGAYNIHIGSGISGDTGDSNTIRIGYNSYQNRCFIGGIRSRTTGANDAIPVVIDSNGQLGTVSSSIRFKEDVQDMGAISGRLLDLRPVTFRYKGQSGGIHFGLIAEEVDQVLPELVIHNKEGEIETVAYHELPPMLLNELQKQRARIDALQRDVENMKVQMKELVSLLKR